MDHIDVVKEYDEISRIFGKIFIKTKNPKDFNFLTLEQITKQNASDATPCLFMINDEFVNDTSDIKIDSSYILKCEIINTKEVRYLQNLPSPTILNIMTRIKSNPEQQNQIRIRGKGTDPLQIKYMETKTIPPYWNGYRRHCW